MQKNQTSLWKRIANGALFYFGWAVCLWGATHELAWLGVLVSFAIVSLHLWVSSQRLKDCLMIFMSCLGGLLMDSAYQSFGLITYQSPNFVFASVAPLWVISLYALLGISIDHSLGWMKGRPVLSALVGSAGGVASYAAGERAGVALFSSPETLVVVGLVWLLFMPALVAWCEWLDRQILSRENS